MGKKSGFNLFLKCFATTLGITFGIFVIPLCNTYGDLALVGAFILVVAVLALLANVFSHRFAVRRAALKALGMQGGIAVRKDKVARIAYKGILCFMHDDYPKAEEYLMQAYSMSDVRNNQLFCIEWLLRLYESVQDTVTGELDTASKIRWCMCRSAEIASDNPECQSRLGHAYYLEGKLTKAEYYFEQAIRFDPNHGYSYFSLAKIYVCRGEDERAVEILEKLLEIQENHPLVFSELAIIYAMHNDEVKSEEYYKKAIMCGFDRPQMLSDKLSAIKKFNNSKDADLGDLPKEYYRYIRKDDEDEPKEKNCSSTCPHCELNKKSEKEVKNAGNE